MACPHWLLPRDGCQWHRQQVGESALQRLILAVDNVVEPRRGGIRQVQNKYPAVADFLRQGPLAAIARQHLAQPGQLVRALWFDKTPQNNWLVTWHQDKTVALNRRFTHPDWGPWSLKDGIHHVQPPLAVLQQMLTLRLHLDDCPADNGALRLLPGTHQRGLLSPTQIQQILQQSPEPVYCEARAGDILAMRPHILHASSKASIPTRRRILHVEYCSYTLPSGVHWAA